MDDVDVPDSEDESWRSPWTSSLRLSPDVLAKPISPAVGTNETADNLSPDELVADLEENSKCSDVYVKSDVLGELPSRDSIDTSSPGILSTGPASIDVTEFRSAEQLSGIAGTANSAAAERDEHSRLSHVAPNLTPINVGDHDIDTSEGATNSAAPRTRILRPRTYQQLHTYEYEHAKYVMECRAAGIKPVRFDGSRYREMDKADKDFLPARAAVLPRSDTYGDLPYSSPLQEFSSGSETSPKSLPDVISQTSRKRKRIQKVSRYKDPRSFVTTPAEASKPLHQPCRIDPDVFSFPSDHWQNEPRDNFWSSDLTAQKQSSPENVFQQNAFDQRLTDIYLIDSENSSSSSASSESEAAAKQRFARKLKGVLPPSFLSRKGRSHLNHESPVSKVRETTLSSVLSASKGVARKKTSTQIRPLISAFSSDGEDNSTQYISNSDNISRQHNRSNETVRYSSAVLISSDDDIPEAEEAIDRMICQGSTRQKPNRFTSFVKKYSRHQASQSIRLPNLLPSLPKEQLTSDLRIASRTVRTKPANIIRHNTSTIRSRKNTSLSSRTMHKVNKSRDSVKTHDKNPSIIPNIAQFAQSRGAISAKKGQFSSKGPGFSRQSRITAYSRRDPDQISGPDSDIQLPRAAMARSANPIAEASSEDSLTQGFFTNEIDTESIDNVPPALPNAGGVAHSKAPLLLRPDTRTDMPRSAIVGRTFATAIEHESGRYVHSRCHATSRHKSDHYFHRFDVINNIFNKEEGHLMKVSNWQRQQILSAVQPSSSDAAKNAEMVAKHTQPSTRRKHKTTRKVLLQKTIPYCQDMRRAEQPVPSDKVDMASIAKDIDFGCTPVMLGTYFSPRTFLGSSRFGHMLGDVPLGGIKSCYIAGKQVHHDMDPDQSLEHGFTYIDHTLRATDNDTIALSDTDLDIYAFLLFATSMSKPAILQTNGHLLCLRKEAEQLRIYGLRQRRLHVWFHIFSLSTAYLLSFSSHTDPNPSGHLVDTLDQTVRFLLELGFDSLCTSLRRQREETRRANGIGLGLDDAILELWVIVFHISQKLHNSFWSRINNFMNLDAAYDYQIMERAWRTIFSLTPITQFDIFGVSSSSQVANWSAVLTLFNAATTDYPLNNTADNSARDEMVKQSMRRLFILVSKWKWSGSSTLLGHGRSGGPLYEFFFQKMHLAPLRSELPAKIEFPEFMRHLEDKSCLQITESQNTFGVFLQLVCLGIEQYIGELQVSDLTRAKKRGLGIVDKFSTLGKLSYSAEDSLERTTVFEIQNRYALEIAVYWAAGDWKDRGLQKLIHASVEAMPGSHLILRDMQIQAWTITIKMQLQRSEESCIDSSMRWLTSVIQTTISDVLQFRHQSRLDKSDAKAIARLNKDLKKCHDLLNCAYNAYLHVLSNTVAFTTVKRTCLLWENDLLKPILQLHESFNMTASNSLLKKVFLIINRLFSSQQSLQENEDSQDYGNMELSQEVQGLVDYDNIVVEKVKSLTSHIFQFLTNITTHERITVSLKTLARLGLQSFSVAVRLMHSKARLSWRELFDDRGAFSWSRLLDRPIKGIMLPYFLAILIENEADFYEEMQPFIISTWFSSIVHLEIRDSLAAFTTVLINREDCWLLHDTSVQPVSDRYHVSSQNLDFERLPLLISALRALESLQKERKYSVTIDPVEQVSRLTHSIKNHWESLSPNNDDKKAKYLNLIQHILVTLHQYCSRILRAMSEEQSSSIHWLKDSKNFPQLRDNFAPDLFRAFAVDDISRKGLEVAMTVIARCSVDVICGTHDLGCFLSTALSNDVLGNGTAPVWDPQVAVLRMYIIKTVLAALFDLYGEHPVARLYSRVLGEALVRVYETLSRQSWSGSSIYINSLFREAKEVTHFSKAWPEDYLSECLSNLIRHLKKYTYLECEESADPADFSVERTNNRPDPRIVQAFRMNFKDNWTVLPAGLYHVKRHVTVSLPFESCQVQNSSKAPRASAVTFMNTEDREALASFFF